MQRKCNEDKAREERGRTGSEVRTENKGSDEDGERGAGVKEETELSEK